MCDNCKDRVDEANKRERMAFEIYKAFLSNPDNAMSDRLAASVSFGSVNAFLVVADEYRKVEA
jgi:hypothetical protein